MLRLKSKLFFAVLLALGAIAFFLHKPQDEVSIKREVVLESLSDPTLLSKINLHVEHDTHGYTRGYTVVNVEPGSLFDQAGIKNGDLISWFNGRPVAEFSQAQISSDRLADATVGIVRDGYSRTLKINIR